MVIAVDSTGLAAIKKSPSRAGLRGLDAVNLFLAGELSGFGPYVAVFLADQNWTQQNIGFVLTAAGFAGLLSQLPGGELLDTISSKRIRGRGGRHYGCRERTDHRTLADFPAGIGRSDAASDNGRVPWAGDCRHQPWPRWPRSAWRATRTQSKLRFDGRCDRGRPDGPHQLFRYRIARYSSPRPHWCFRCSLLSAASSLQTSTTAPPAAPQTIRGRARR